MNFGILILPKDEFSKEKLKSYPCSCFWRDIFSMQDVFGYVTPPLTLKIDKQVTNITTYSMVQVSKVG